MKPTTIILLLCLCFSDSFGQRKPLDKTLSGTTFPETLYDSLTKAIPLNTTAYFTWYKNQLDSLMNEEKRDTISSLLIVVDTGFATTNEVINADSLLNGKTYYLGIASSKPSPYAYYLNGYEVRKQSDVYYGIGRNDYIQRMEHEKYLDADKNILPKNVIVIQSISK